MSEENGSVLDECKAVLEEIAKAKMPMIKGMAAPSKIEQLESYLLETAERRQEAHQAKLMVQQALDVLQGQWDELEGWEVELPTNGRRTSGEVLEAKRRTNPGLYSSIQTGKRLVDRLGDQIRRLEKDDQVCSRTYTMLTGA